MVAMILWAVYAGLVLGVGRQAYRDWRNPDGDRQVTAVTMGIFALMFTVTGFLIWALA